MPYKKLSKTIVKFHSFDIQVDSPLQQKFHQSCMSTMYHQSVNSDIHVHRDLELPADMQVQYLQSMLPRPFHSKGSL